MRALVFLALLAGCLESSEVHCGDLVCPQGRVCATVSIAGEPTFVCATQDQVDSCIDENGDPKDTCTLQGQSGTCHDGICYANVCGNGVVDSGELCDDGNVSDSLTTDDGQIVPDACSSNCMSDQTCGNGVVDVINGEDCDIGRDGIEHDGCSSGCRVETPRFESLDSVNSGSFFGLAYDTDRHRTLMFGGPSATNTHLQARVHGRWRLVPSPSTPQSREAAMAYDRDRHELVMYGSTMQDVGLRDTWTRDKQGWHLRTFLPNASVPDVAVFNLVYDAAHHRVVMVGAAGGVAGGALETWAWNGNTWSQIAMSAAIPARDAGAVGYDEERGVVVLFGGLGTDALDDLWELDGDTWTQRTKQGMWPEGRFLALLTYDPNKHTMVLVGGSVDSPVWDWNGSTWTQSPGPSTSGAIVTDLDRKRVVLVASETNVLIVRERRPDGTWVVEGDSIPAAAASAPPDLRASPVAALDPRAGEIVVFGGNRAGVNTQETFTWRDSWRAVASASKPAAREAAMMVYDPIHEEMVLFGGCSKCAVGDHILNDGNAPGAVFYNDTWTFRAGQWTPHPQANPPEARAQGAMAWDNRRGRVVLLGGIHENTTQSVAALRTMWSWTGTQWVADSPAHLPPAMSGASIAYDPASNNVVMFGGATYNNVFFPLRTGTSDTWIWDGTDWSQPSISLPPPPRTQGAFAWNVARQRLELFGGESVFSLMRNDLWEWNGATSTWAQVDVVNAPPTTSHVMVSLPDGSGLAIIGGGSTPEKSDYATVRTLRWDSDDGREEACVDTDYDGDGFAGCADPDCWFDCNVECPLATSCTIGPRCGDMMCNDTAAVGAGRATEDCASCPADCGACQ